MVRSVKFYLFFSFLLFYYVSEIYADGDQLTLENSTNDLNSQELNEEVIRRNLTNLLDDATSIKKDIEKANRLISQTIQQMIQVFKKEGSISFPNAEPFFKEYIKMNHIELRNVTVYGLSNFIIEYINTNFTINQIYLEVFYKELNVTGDRLYGSYQKKWGSFNLLLENVLVKISTEIKKDEDIIFVLHEKITHIDMSFGNCSSVGQTSIKCSTLKMGSTGIAKALMGGAFHESVAKEVNEQIRKLNDTVPLNLPPLDLAISAGRKYVKENNLDPYELNNVHVKRSFFTVNITNFWLSGLSNFYRVGEVDFLLESKEVQLGLHLATEEIFGHCSWSFEIGTINKTGTTNFTIDHLQIKAYVNQSIDISNKPKLSDLNLYLGKLKLDVTGLGSLDRVIEIAVNSLPDMLRHAIVDSLEEPIKIQIQKFLDVVDLEQVVDENLPKIDMLLDKNE